MKKPPASFTAFAGRHAAPPAPPKPVPPPAKTPSVVARPLRLNAAVTRMLQDLSAARPGLSLNELITVLIVETWDQVFRPSPTVSTSTISAAVAAAVTAQGAPSESVSTIVEAALNASLVSLRSPRDTTLIPNATGEASARTLRLRPEVDAKLGELARHYGGLDRNSTISLLLTLAWHRTSAGVGAA